MANPRAIEIGAIALCLAISGASLGQDWDSNGLSDSYEHFLAERFKPALLINAGNILEPEPIEIMDKNGNGYIDVGDVDVMEFWIDGAMNCSGGFCDCLPQATVCLNPDAPQRFYNQDMRGWVNSATGLAYVSLVDYGGAGNENAADWRNTYLNGRGATLPGSEFEPTVYCHFTGVNPSTITIQYWFFYPYNDGWNNHEGDWEHINVRVSNAGDSATIVNVDYFYHENFTRISNPYTIGGSHPVVFVGGSYHDQPIYVPNGDGATSGASWPCFGDFSLQWNGLPIGSERVSSGGRTLLPEDMTMVMMPNFDRLEGLPGGIDLSPWFEAHPQYHWMRLALHWGHFVTDSPVPYIAGGETSIITPSCRESWTQTDGDDRRDQDEAWEDRDPVIVVAGRNDGQVVSVGHQYSVNGEVVRSATTTSNFKVGNRPTTVTVSAADQLSDQDSQLRFVGWSDGRLDNPRQETFAGTDRDLRYLEASYRTRSGSWREDNQALGLWAGTGGAWGDCDGDGLDDLFLLDSNYSGVLLHSTGTGYVEQQSLQFESGVCGAAWGDCDNDGDLDLCLVPEAYGSVIVSRYDSGALGEPEPIFPTENGMGGALWIDLDRDGNLDLLLYGTKEHQAQLALMNDGNGNFSWSEDLNVPTSAGCALGDFDGDGDLDICALGDRSIGSAVFRGESGAYVEDMRFAGISTWDQAQFAAAWVDYDNDDDLDLQVNSRVYQNTDGHGQMALIFEFPISDAVATSYANWADFNSDGWIDVIINGRLYRNDHGNFTDLTTWIEWPAARPGRWEWVDYDGDGDLDLFSFGSPLQLMENTEDATDRFVRVNLQGTTSNRNGVGAALRFPNGLRPLCQSSGVANSATRGLIGVGDLSAPYGLGVTWPSGTRHTVQVGAGTHSISIVEPTGIAQVSSNALLADGIERDYALAVQLSPLAPVLNAAVDIAALGTPGTLPLRDDGLGTDATAGDGIYTSAFFRTTLDYYQYYYPRVTADLADGTHLERRVEVLLLSQDTNLPTIAEQAAYRIRAGSDDASAVLAVAVDAQSAPVIVSADLTALGASGAVPLRDDGLGEDIKQGDDIYTSAAFVAVAPTPGSYNVLVTAARISGAAAQQAVSVAAVSSAAKFASDREFAEPERLGDALSAGLTARPYSSVYFRARPNEDECRSVMITTFDDNATPPGIWGRALQVDGSEGRFESRGSLSQPSWLVDDLPEGSRGVCYADFDNDGDTDFFLCNPTCGGKLFVNYLNDTNCPAAWQGKFINRTSAICGADSVYLEGALAASWGDYTGDGFVDLFVSTGTYTDPIDEIGELPLPAQSGMNGGDLRLFRNRMGSTMRKSLVWGSSSGAVCLSGCWVDLDNDGDIDHVSTRYVDGGIGVLENHGINSEHTDQVLESVTWTITEPFYGGNSVTVIDYDHDPYPDLLVTEVASGHLQARILRNRYGSSEIRGFDSTVFAAGGAWNGAVVADLNLDGQDDFVLLPRSANVVPALYMSIDYTQTPEFEEPWPAIQPLGGPVTPTYRDLGYMLGIRDGRTGGGFAADLDGDHAPDLFLGRDMVDSQGQGSGEQCLYRSTGTAGVDNHWLQVKLRTRGDSNGSLVGTRVQVFANGKQWLKSIDGGSFRGGQGSNDLLFGLGSETNIDHVSVVFPSGETKTLDSPAVDSEVVVWEGDMDVLAYGKPGSALELEPGFMGWVFKWKTGAIKGDLKLDKVEIYPYGGDQENFEVLQWGVPNVNVLAYREGGVWIHELRLNGLPCIEGTQWTYRVSSSAGVGGETLAPPEWKHSPAATYCLPENYGQ